MARIAFVTGLPGVGKSSISGALASLTGAVWLRIDTIEDAIKASLLAPEDVVDAGYRVAAAQASHLLAQGRDVIVDCVNEDDRGRDLYANLLKEALIVEIVCSDKALHEARVTARHGSEPGTPDWPTVERRVWQDWSRPVLKIDSASLSIKAAAQRIASVWA